MDAGAMVRFDCGVCLESFEAPENDVRRISHSSDDCVCPDCVPTVISLFDAAIVNEIDYPPRWGEWNIDIAFWWQELSAKGLSEQWYRKVDEYETPVLFRVYCQHKISGTGGSSDGTPTEEFCNNFLEDASEITDDDEVVRCRIYKGWTCLKCRATVHQHSEVDTHACIDEEDVEQPETLDETTRGSEWQYCAQANCRVGVSLGSGCNAMTCAFCDTEFCFLCGKEASHDSGHWMAGQPCSRWGKVDAQNQMYDRTPQANRIEQTEDGALRVFLNVGQLEADIEHLAFGRDEVITLSVELSAETFALVLEHGRIPRAVDELLDLLDSLRRNLDHIILNLALHDAPVQDRERTNLDPVYEAVEATNFTIRHEKLLAHYLDTYRDALALVESDSMLHEIPGEEVFQWYLADFKPKYDASLMRFINTRDAGRRIWVEGGVQADQRRLE